MSGLTLAQAHKVLTDYAARVQSRAEALRRFADSPRLGDYQATADHDADVEEQLCASLRVVLAEVAHVDPSQQVSALHLREVIEKHVGNHTAAHQAANALKRRFVFACREGSA